MNPLLNGTDYMPPTLMDLKLRCREGYEEDLWFSFFVKQKQGFIYVCIGFVFYLMILMGREKDNWV